MYRRKSLGQIENAKAPYICKIIPPQRIGAFIQLIVSVVVLYFGASEMVSVVNQLALGLGLSVMGLAIIVVPAATAVPETASALIWGFRGQDTLSIASLVGEKVLYTTSISGNRIAGYGVGFRHSCVSQCFSHYDNIPCYAVFYS